jgi:hypothetical protein
MLQREQISEFARTCFPHCLRTTEIPMLLEKGPTKSRLSGDGALGWFLRPCNYSEKRGFSASIASEDSPAVAPGDRKRDALEYFRRAEFDPDVRYRDLSQLRSTLAHAVRQRSNVSSV